MESVFLAIISQLNSAVFVLLAILLLAFWTTYKMGGLVTYFRETKSENRRTDLEIDEIRDTLSSVRATTDLLYRAHINLMRQPDRGTSTRFGENSHEPD